MQNNTLEVQEIAYMPQDSFSPSGELVGRVKKMYLSPWYILFNGSSPIAVLKTPSYVEFCIQFMQENAIHWEAGNKWINLETKFGEYNVVMTLSSQLVFNLTNRSFCNKGKTNESTSA